MWVRNLYSGPGGGLYTGPGGGLYDGPDFHPYMCNWPPIPVLVGELIKRGMLYQARLIANAYGVRI